MVGASKIDQLIAGIKAATKKIKNPRLLKTRASALKEALGALNEMNAIFATAGATAKDGSSALAKMKTGAANMANFYFPGDLKTTFGKFSPGFIVQE